jgi:hypothetical protein
MNRKPKRPSLQIIGQFPFDTTDFSPLPIVDWPIATPMAITKRPFANVMCLLDEN